MAVNVDLNVVALADHLLAKLAGLE